MNSTTTTLRTMFDDYSSVEQWKYGLAWLVLLLLSFQTCAQSPTLFMPGSISTPYKERDMTISSDGNHLLYSIHSYDDQQRMIVEMIRKDKNWSRPEVVSFSGNYRDIEPMFDPSGTRLFFASNRPLSDKDQSGDYDIWYVQKEDNGWGTPIALDTIINTSGDEFYPSMSNNGTLYFTATKKEGKGKEDIYYSRWSEGRFQTPASMDSAINTSTYEFNSFIDPDEDYILFSSYGRPDGLGGGDLYISFRGTDGRWKSAINLGEQVNSGKLDYCPFVSTDGEQLYFSSSRKDDKKPRSITGLRQMMDRPQNGFDDIYVLPMTAILPLKDN